MARLWQAGPHFNTTTGDVEFTTYSGTVSVQSTVTRLGPFAIRTNPAANTGFIRQVIYAADSSTSVFARAYVRFASFPTADCTMFRISNLANNPCAQIRFINSTSKFVLLDSAATQVGSASATLSLNTWYRLEVNLDASSSPGSLTARLDGTQFATGASPAQAPWQRVLWGPVTSSTTDIYWTDFAVNDTSGSSQNTWPGSGALTAIFPDSAGDANGWNNTSNAAGGTNNYQLVDENPPNDVTDMVQTGTVNTEDMYNMSASGIGSNDTINVVAIGARFRNNVADTIAAMKVQVKKTSGGTILQSAAISPNDVNWQTNTPVQPRNYPIVSYLDPDNSVAWTQTTVDSMQVGQKLTTANTNRIQVTSVWASIDYTPSTTTPISGTDTGAGADSGSVAADVAATETGAGADTTALSATTTATETGAGVDAGTVAATLPGTETGTGADAGTVGAAIPQADTGAGADTASLSASLSATETAAGVETTSLTVFAFETATGVDATALAVTQSDSDTGSSVDTGSLAAAQSNGDNAAGVDAASVSVSITVTDTGTAANTEQVAQDTVPISASDTASGTDVASLLASIAAAETGTSLDGLTDRTLGSNESGAGADTSTISALLFSGDTASAVQTEILAASPASSEDVSADDAITALDVSLTAADIATGLEAFFVEGGDNQSVFADDTVTGADDGALAVGIVFDDPTSSIETTSVFVAILVSDVAVATEGSPRIGLSSADTVTVTDNAAPFVTLATADSGTAFDTNNNLNAATSSSDSAVGAEVISALQVSVSSGDSGAGAEASPAPPAAMVIGDSASGAEALIIRATTSSADVATAVHQAFILATVVASADTATSADSAAFTENPLVSIFAADQVSAVDFARVVINVFSGDAASVVDLASVSILKTSGDTATGAETISLLVSVFTADTGHGRDATDVFIKPTRSHRVMPYYIRESQDWAIEQERRRHNEALWYVGENTMFVLMWHLEDFQDGLVGRCPTCYESQGRIATVYGQSDEYKCPDCFGTTFEGGFKALIVRPAIFSDSDEGETRHSRGIVHPQDLTIESTPDFRIRTGDYCFRVNGDRYYMRVPERITLRTGFGRATQTGAAIGYNHANAAVEDPDSVAYMIPPLNDEISQILNRASRIPRDWSTFEIIRAPLIPSSDLIGGS